MPRPKVSLLSLDLIADAAIALADSGEPFGVNALARRLKVTPSSLYNHVDGKDAIIELMRGRLALQYMPDVPTGDWESVIVANLRSERRLYAEHPLIVPLIIGKTITDSHVTAQYDALATALVAGGFPESEVLTIIAIIDSFALGFGLDLASPENIWRPETPTRTLGRLVEQAETGNERSDRAFEVGMGLLLDSLRLHLHRVTAALAAE